MTLPFAVPDIGPEEIEGVVECLKSGWLTSGQKVAEFEDRFAAYVGAKHAIAVNSATSAALLILDALRVQGREVIVPTYTFSGPAMMAHKLGARVVLADCRPGSYQIDPEQVARLITPFTAAVMPTHFGGSSCDMRSLREVCEKRGVPIIDDAAHAFPTTDPFSGLMVGNGSASLATFFSFYATKTLTTGEGGMITTSDDKLARKLRSTRSHGFDRQVFDRYTNVKTGWRYDIADAGWKANLTDVAAAIGLVQLKRADDLCATRANLAEDYFQRLYGVRGIRLPDYDPLSAWHLFPIQVERKRTAFIARMGELGVQCSVHFIPLHEHSAWERILGRDGTSRIPFKQYPNADQMFAGEVSLPLYSKMTSADTKMVADKVKEALAC